MKPTGGWRASRIRAAWASVAAIGLAGCAASSPPPPAQAPPAPAPEEASPPPAVAPATPPPPPPAAAAPPAVCGARVGEHGLRRSALTRTLDAGLGQWLRGVDVEPMLEAGRFRGWRVRGLPPGDPCWTDVDLRAGDVVSRINRRPIERPEEAHAVWIALRTAQQIVVDYVRAGTPRALRFDVIDDDDDDQNR